MDRASGGESLFGCGTRAAIRVMTEFEQHLRGFWSQGGWHVTALVPIGWVVVAVAMRSGFSRRTLGLRVPCAAACAALAAGLVSEQHVRRSARALMAETGLGSPGADLLAAIEQAAIAPRLLGAAIALFTLALIAFGMARRRLMPVAPTPSKPASWRLAASFLLLFAGALFATFNLATLALAVVSPSMPGAMWGGLSAAFLIMLGSAIGSVATGIRDGATPRAVTSAVPTP
jgi:hypothetical protein